MYSDLVIVVVMFDAIVLNYNASMSHLDRLNLNDMKPIMCW